MEKSNGGPNVNTEDAVPCECSHGGDPEERRDPAGPQGSATPQGEGEERCVAGAMPNG